MHSPRCRYGRLKCRGNPVPAVVSSRRARILQREVNLQSTGENCDGRIGAGLGDAGHRRWDRFSALNALRFPFSKTMRYRCPSGPAAIAIMVPNSPSLFVPTIKTESPTLNSSDSLLMTCHFYSMWWMTIRRFLAEMALPALQCRQLERRLEF